MYRRYQPAKSLSTTLLNKKGDYLKKDNRHIKQTEHQPLKNLYALILSPAQPAGMVP
jgi:hypothetical protein